jgi:hypothetical protein
MKEHAMRPAHRLITLCTLSLLTLAPPLLAQNQEERFQQLERRITDLEQSNRQKDEKINRLEQQLKDKPVTTTPTPTPTDADIERVRSDVLRDLDTRDPLTGRPRSGAPGGPARPAATFNPDIAVITDFFGSWSSRRSNDAYNRFDIREVELDIRAAVDPRADGVVILAFERDVENPVFPELNGEEEGGGPDTSVNIEEAYLFLHDFGVRNLTAKVGRFHLRFGRQNMLHLHDLPTSDPPLVNQAFLAPEALIDQGLSLSYVLPPRFTANQYVELIAEIITGEGGGSESASLPGDLTVDSPAFNLHALWNADFARNWNLELGGSWLWGRRDASNDLEVSLFGLDATLLRRDPKGGFNNQLFQAELIAGHLDTEDAGTQNSWGAYLLAQQQINRDWYAGLRLDYTENPDDDSQHAWAVNPYLSWYWSEFLRFRLQYQHRDGDVESTDAIFFQLTWVFGAHPPHPYWSMK